MHKEESGSLQDFPWEAETKLLVVLLKALSSQGQGWNTAITLQTSAPYKTTPKLFFVCPTSRFLSTDFKTLPGENLITTPALQKPSQDEFLPRNSILLKHFYAEVLNYKTFNICIIIGVIIEVICRRTNIFTHPQFKENWFKILVKRRTSFFDKRTFFCPPPKNLRPNKGLKARNNMIRKTRKIKNRKRKEKRTQPQRNETLPLERTM